MGMLARSIVIAYTITIACIISTSHSTNRNKLVMSLYLDNFIHRNTQQKNKENAIKSLTKKHKSTTLLQILFTSSSTP